MAITHLYRATYPNKHWRFRLRCVINCVMRGNRAAGSPRTVSRPPLKPSPRWGGRGAPGSRTTGGKTIMRCATVQVFVKKGVKHG